MKNTRFTEEQKAFALRQAESGVPVEEIIRKMGISEATFYRWKKKFGGLAVAISSDRNPPRLETNRHDEVAEIGGKIVSIACRLEAISSNPKQCLAARRLKEKESHGTQKLSDVHNH